MCNTLTNVAAPVVPTCVSGTVPTGTGGAVADGTYVLSSQTYYNVPACPSESIAGTFTFSGGCLQGVAGVDRGQQSYTLNATFAVQGSEMTVNVTCASLAGGNADAPVSTFTATGSTLTRFIRNSATGDTNPDRVEVYTKQ
jgi:hypothetical protein